MSVATAARPVLRVVEHHVLVYRRTWRGTVFSTFFTPLLFLAAIGVGLAYDDFGAGQARLLELVEVPPDYLKFDTTLVGNMHEAPASKLRLVETLVTMVRDMGIACIAEGVETEAGLAFCQNMGFHYVQGFAVGRPAPVTEWLKDWPADVSGRR